jgi:hypothetical protein
MYGTSTRRGIMLPALAITIVAMVGFLALAIDLGMLAVAKTQAQNAADLSSLAAARTLNGNSSNNYNQSSATTNAQNLLSYNAILGNTIASSQLTLTYGSYDYSQSAQSFSANYPATTGQPETAVKATITSNNNLNSGFSKIFGSSLLPNVTATAQAAHRPRDLGLVMDLSGSMRFGTMLGFDITTSSRATNNPDTNVPTWGAYSGTGDALVGGSVNQTSSFDSYTISPTNTTTATSSYALTYINSFYQNAAYASTLVRAFDSYTSTDGGNTWTAPTTGTPQLPPSSYATTPGGDVPLFKLGSTTTYAQTVKDVLGSSTMNIMWELDGYSAYTNGTLDTSGTNGGADVWTMADYSAAGVQFNGYTKGPGYYGKTFFLWPPDPRTTVAFSSANLQTFLKDLGVNSADASTLASNWSTWLGQGTTTGLANLQNWLKTSSTYSGHYTTTGPMVTGFSKAPIYYAVCRLFNRAYPAGPSGGQFSADWRYRFFGTTNNQTLLNSAGSLDAPQTGGFTINYNAILSWLTQTSDPFPTQLRAGRIKYYSAIPTSITGSWPSYGSTDQRFWVGFIDHVLGLMQTSSGNYTDVSAMAGYGSDFTWGTMAQTAPPTAPQYMSYTDNPLRPNLRHWFSPILMVDYMHNYNIYENQSSYFFIQPGDSYEAPLYTGKQAFLAAINTIENNHPNDWFTLAFYSQPRNSASDTNRFNGVACPLGTNYNYAKSSLFFPFSTINADGSPNDTEVTPYDADASLGTIPSANFEDTPRPKGNTCFAMGLMLCYNQFAVTPSSDTTLRTFTTSSPIAFPTAMAGGMGRKGAQKVIIFETDGLANTTATASLISVGSGANAYNYYQIRYDMNKPSSSEYPSTATYTINNSTVTSQVYSLVSQLVSTYGTTRNPFRLYAIGFGPVFASGAANAAGAETTLQTMQYYAGTQSSASTALPSNQIITGSDSTMSANMISTFTSILENGVQIALIK